MIKFKILLLSRDNDNNILLLYYIRLLYISLYLRLSI